MDTMKHDPATAYRRAFVAYLRTGAPIRLALKEAGPATHYVWRTVGDERVRLSHAANDGRMFAWDEPPATGHPGEDFGCRCRAEPYVPGETEFAYHEIVGELVDEPERWEWDDFLRHLYSGGAPVSLSRIGHLNDVVHQFAYRDGDTGAHSRLSSQIVAEARDVMSGSLTVTFDRTYDFTDVAYPHGDAVVYGQFSGSVSNARGYLAIKGRVQFNFWDIFTDPADLREIFLGTSDPAAVHRLARRTSDLGGRHYTVADHWETRFEAEALVDARLSRYK
jgi:SPP1 gp7 family putative phage head morphogenesis protein